MIKNAKIEKSDVKLSTYVQYIEDLKFLVNVAGILHRLPEKEIAKWFISGLKPDIFLWRNVFKNLDIVVQESREELSTYRDILEISDHVKKSEDMECYKCHKKGHYANKCPEIKAKDTKGPLKVRKMEESITQDEVEKKSIRQIRVYFSDLESETKDQFMRFWVILSNLGQENWCGNRGILWEYSWKQALTVTLFRENFMKHWFLKS